MSEFSIPEAISPGEYVRDFMDGKGWTQDDLARILGRPLKTVNGIINGSKAITPQSAQELAAAFGTSPQLWMNLESAYRLKLNPKEAAEVERRKNLYELAPVREMEKRGWIPKSKSNVDLESSLKVFFDVDSLDAPIELPMAARTSLRSDVGFTMEQRAWSFRAARLARLVTVKPYQGDISEESMRNLRILAAHPESARLIPRTLAEIGIRFVVVEHLSKTRMAGAAFWLDSKSPVIAVCMRYDRIDHLWHTLIHELFHIKKRHAFSFDQEEGLGMTSVSSVTQEEENEVDEEASGFLIPPDKLRQFMIRFGPRYDKQSIIQFANLVKIHPGIVVGQLHHHGMPYSYFTDMCVKVKSILVQEAMTDGHGKFIEI